MIPFFHLHLHLFSWLLIWVNLALAHVLNHDFFSSTLQIANWWDELVGLSIWPMNLFSPLFQYLRTPLEAFFLRDIFRSSHFSPEYSFSLIPAVKPVQGNSQYIFLSPTIKLKFIGPVSSLEFHRKRKRERNLESPLFSRLPLSNFSHCLIAIRWESPTESPRWTLSDSQNPWEMITSLLMFSDCTFGSDFLQRKSK